MRNKLRIDTIDANQECTQSRLDSLETTRTLLIERIELIGDSSELTQSTLRSLREMQDVSNRLAENIRGEFRLSSFTQLPIYIS